MILARTLKAAAAAAIVASSAVVAVVAGAFALYQLLLLALNPAASAAIVAGLFAVIGLVGAVFTTRAFEREAPPETGGFGVDPALIGKLTELAGDHPLLSAGAAVAAGALAIKNPELAASIIKALLEGQTAQDPAKKPHP